MDNNMKRPILFIYLFNFSLFKVTIFIYFLRSFSICFLHFASLKLSNKSSMRSSIISSSEAGSTSLSSPKASQGRRNQSNLCMHTFHPNLARSMQLPVAFFLSANTEFVNPVFVVLSINDIS